MFNVSSATNTSFGIPSGLGSNKKDLFNSSTFDFFDPPPPPGGPGGGFSPLFNQPFLDLVPYQVIDLSFLRKFEVFNSILNAFGDLFSSKTQITPTKDFFGSKSPFPLHSKLDIFDTSSIPPIILQCYGVKVGATSSPDGSSGAEQVAQEKTPLDLSKLSSHSSATSLPDRGTGAERVARRVQVFKGELADLQKLQASGLDLGKLKYRFRSGFVTLADLAIKEGHLHILEYLGGDIRALRFLCKNANQGCKLPAVCAASKGKREVLRFLAKRAYPFQFTELRLGTLDVDTKIDMRDIKQEDLLKMENVLRLLGIERLSPDEAWFYFRVLRICLLTDRYFDEISAALIEGNSSATAEFLINLKLEGQTVSPQERALALALSAPAALDLFLTLSLEPIDFDQLVKDVSNFICLNKKIPPGNPKPFQDAYMATIDGQGYELIQVKRPKRQALLNFLEYAYCNDLDLGGVTAECLNSFNESNEKILPLIIMMNLAKEGNISSLEEKINLQPDDPYLGRTLAHAAAATGQTEVLKFLVDSDIFLDKQDNLGQRPIHLAALHGHQSTVEFLIDKKCERSFVDDSGNSPLHLAASNGHTSVVQLLRDCESDYQNEHGLTPAHFAAEGGHLEFLQELKKKKASMCIQDNEREDIFHAAAHKGHLNILQAAKDLDKDQDFSGKNNNGKTVMHIAAEGGFLEIVEWLRDKGFIVNTPDENGETPAQVAESLGYAEIKKVILSSNNPIKAYAPFITAICVGVVIPVALAALFPQDLP